LADFIIASKANGILQPLAQHYLKANLVTYANLTQKLHNILSTNEGEAGEDKDERLNELGGLGRSQSSCHCLKQLGQEGAEPLLASLFYKLGCKSTNFVRAAILDGGSQKTVDNVQTDFESRTAVFILPSKDLVVIVHEHVLYGFGAGTENLALQCGHQNLVEFRQRSRDKAGGQRFRTMLYEGYEQLDGQLLWF
jgi:hypothetical protein